MACVLRTCCRAPALSDAKNLARDITSWTRAVSRKRRRSFVFGSQNTGFWGMGEGCFVRDVGSEYGDGGAAGAERAIRSIAKAVGGS
jgi:hypothetical protein